MTPCGEIESRCECALEAHDAGPHVCECGGSWERTDESFIIHAIPGDSGTHPRAPEEIVDALMALNGPLPWTFKRGARREPIRFLTPPEVVT